MILRIVLGRLLAGRDANALSTVRDELTDAARQVRGLESLILGARRTASTGGAAGGEPPIEAAIATIWGDVESMLAATGIDETDRFLTGRLALPVEVERRDHFELVERRFAALPPQSVALVRILRIRARQRDEARLLETLRAQQPRLIDLGLIASHLGRRVSESGEVEAVLVNVWPDRATVRAATRDDAEAPLFADDLAEWSDRVEFEMFDGIEIAPHLPSAAGPPLLILDEASRIVDLTTSAAAVLGLPAADLVGRPARALFADPAGPGGSGGDGWPVLLADGGAHGEAPWDVPDIGAVLVRYVARRDTPIDGRHAVIVRRHHDPAPTDADLDAALVEAFHLA